MTQALAYLLVVCWRPAIKSRGEGEGIFYCHIHLARLEFSVPNNVDNDCVAWHFAHLLNIA